MKSKKLRPVLDSTSKSNGGEFRDKISVYTSSFGTQYVLPAELLIERSELESFVRSITGSQDTEKS